jgi:hypothetical protein
LEHCGCVRERATEESVLIQAVSGTAEPAMVDAVLTHLPEDEHRIQLRRAIVASTIGTAIEWYDTGKLLADH